jgi:hypothetical protein
MIITDKIHLIERHLELARKILKWKDRGFVKNIELKYYFEGEL